MNYHDLYLEETGSTNQVAKERAIQGVPHGSGVFARQQSSGRGRLSREWYSPPGVNLYCSYVVRPAIPIREYPKLTMVAGIATAGYLCQASRLAVQLKWPNDVFIGHKKCGGILCESFGSAHDPEGSYAVLGIGLNLNMTREALPHHLQAIATSLQIEGAPHLEPSLVFTELRAAILAGIRNFEAYGFKHTLSDWRQYDYLHGKKMEWERQDGIHVSGICLGPDQEGQLQVLDKNNVIHLIMAGDVRLNR